MVTYARRVEGIERWLRIGGASNLRKARESCAVLVQELESKPDTDRDRVRWLSCALRLQAELEAPDEPELVSAAWVREQLMPVVEEVERRKGLPPRRSNVIPFRRAG